MAARRVSGPRASLVGLVLGGVALLALVGFAWPRGADADVLGAYAELQSSPVPVRVVGWIQPNAASARVLADGYVLTLRAERVGDLTISGRLGSEPASAGSLVWHDGDVTYALDSTLDRAVMEPRVVSLETARRQLTGNRFDIPILYAGYLPAFAAFTAWSAVSLLLWPRRR